MHTYIQMRSAVEGAKLRDVLERCDIVITERKSKDFSVKDIDQDLRRLFGEDDKTLGQYLDDKNALAAAACLIKYLDLLADDELHGVYRVDVCMYIHIHVHTPLHDICAASCLIKHLYLLANDKRTICACIYMYTDRHTSMIYVQLHVSSSTCTCSRMTSVPYVHACMCMHIHVHT